MKKNRKKVKTLHGNSPHLPKNGFPVPPSEGENRKHHKTHQLKQKPLQEQRFLFARSASSGFRAGFV
jgi:hypothetical protein